MKLPVMQLPVVGIVLAIFAEHLTRALRDAADDLAIGQNLIDDIADIVAGGVAHHVNLAGVGIDLDFDDMRAARECQRDCRTRRWCRAGSE